MSQPPSSRLFPYKLALKELSQRTRTPLPSLIVSFGILHELTAIAPLVGVFYASRAAGIGESVVNAIEGGESNWVKDKCREWAGEGEKWAERLGKRYGVFGFEKGITAEVKGKIAGDVANAVVAYGATKVRLVLLSVYSDIYSVNIRRSSQCGLVSACTYPLRSREVWSNLCDGFSCILSDGPRNIFYLARYPAMGLVRINGASSSLVHYGD
jgi:hypothetical protein